MLETVARPYSVAIFNLAKDEGSLSEWSEFLSNLCLICEDCEMNEIIQNPSYSYEKLNSLLISILGEMQKNQQSFLELIIQNKRLMLISHIFQQFEKLKNASNNIVNVDVLSAFALNEGQLSSLKKVLEEKFDINISIECEIDENLLGGLIIHVGDRTIDASLLGKINQFSARVI